MGDHGMVCSISYWVYPPSGDILECFSSIGPSPFGRHRGVLSLTPCSKNIAASDLGMWASIEIFSLVKSLMGGCSNMLH